MNAVWIDVPESFLAERRRLGHDKLDEVWEGVLHMVPPPSMAHAIRMTDLFRWLDRVASRRGLQAFPEGVGVYAKGEPVDYRVPDGVVARPEQQSVRGLEGAELVVEIRSPGDESYEKLAFYATVGVKEAWILEPNTREIEVFTRRRGRLARIEGIESPLLSVTLETVAGPRLRLCDGDDRVEI